MSRYIGSVLLRVFEPLHNASEKRRGERMGDGEGGEGSTVH